MSSTSDPPPLAQLKAAARIAARQKRQALTPRARAAASARICAQLSQLDILTTARCIAAFWPRWDEVDIRHFAIKSISAGRTLCLPKVHAPGQTLSMHNMSASGLVLTTGYGGIMEPHLDSPSFTPAEITAVLVPSISVDRLGNRLGSGLGFYDITIAAMPQATLIAPLFACQLVAQLPIEAHDRPVDMIVTEAGIHTIC